MMRPLIFMSGTMFWIEMVFSLIIILACAIIYVKTRELYNLSSYKGIKYFKNAFLFFGIAFAARLLLRIIAIANGPDRIDRLFFGLGFLIFLYAGLMAGFFLIYSSLWKRFKNPEKGSWLFHPIAATIAALCIIFLLGPATLILITLLFLVAALLAYTGDKKKKNKGGINNLHIIYILLFIAFVANGLAHFFIRISIAASIILYAISSLLFIIILYRVLNNTKSK